MKESVLYLMLLLVQASDGMILGNVSIISFPCAALVTCSAVDLSATTLRWFVNGEELALYSFIQSDTYPRRVDALNATYDSLVGGVNIMVLSATQNENNRDVASFLSTMRVNISALQVAGVSMIACGSFESRLTINVSNFVQALQLPQPLLDCSLSSSENFDAVKASLLWSSAFSLLHSVERYHVSVSPDPSSCSSNQVSPSEVYTCSQLAPGTAYFFTVTAITCGGLEGDSRHFTVHPQAPESPTNISASIVYNTSAFFVLIISWSSANTSFSAPSCTFDTNVNYILTLEDSKSSMTIGATATSEEHCENGECSISIKVIRSNHIYNLSIYTQNAFGPSAVSYMAFFIAGTRELYFSFYFIPTNSSCMMLGLCSSQQELTGCSLQYGTDPMYSTFSQTIHGSVNYPFSLPVFENFTTYYYRASVAVGPLHIHVENVLMIHNCDLVSRDDHMQCQKYWYENVGFSIACGVLIMLLTFLLLVVLPLAAKHPQRKSSRVTLTSLPELSMEKSAVYEEIKDNRGVKSLESTTTAINPAYNALR